MRRLQAFLGAVLLILATPSFAQSQVDSVCIDVLLQDDGSALISERWVIDVDDDITEWYLGKENLGRMDILDFGVTDETGMEYVSEGTGWDIHRNRRQKAGRCGMVSKGGGYELCWGVGSSGPHVYVASYLLTGLVKGYSDRDGFLHMFITDGANPDNVILTFRKKGTILTTENTQVWGFVIFTEMKSPSFSSPWGKSTILLVRVCPIQTDSSFLLGPSTMTSRTLSCRAWLISKLISFCTSISF